MKISKVTLAIAIAWASTATAQPWTVSGTGQGPVTVNGGAVGAEELSGLTWATGDQYYAVSDNGAKLFPLTIQVAPNGGTIVSASIAAAIQLAAGSDVEGVAYNAANTSVFTSDESGPAIREHSIADGSLLQTLSVPSVFADHRSNLSLESLSLQQGQAALWTANEEALSADGPVSSFTAGTSVRLQKFDATLSAAGQWAYVTDAISGDIGGNGRDIEVSGVADLVALPNGDLLVMERALGGSPFGFRIRLYQVDFTGASDVTGLPALAGQTYTPVGKTLLWQGQFSAANFEGIALGPPLAGGLYSLLLVSDNGGGLQQALYALTLTPPPCDPTPRSGCRSAVRSSLKFRRAGGRRDTLTWAWRRGSVENVSVFGNPTVIGGTPYAVCVYDTPGGVAALAWSARVTAGEEWRTAGTRGYRYREPSGAADGIIRMVLRSGVDKGSIVLRGKGIHLQPPDNQGAPMLQDDTDVAIQLVNLDDPAQCFSAVYPSARTSSPDQYSARF